jgi:hypothetical protein
VVGLNILYSRYTMLISRMMDPSFCVFLEPRRRRFLIGMVKKSTFILFEFGTRYHILIIRATFVKGDPYIRDMKNTA